MSSQPPPRDGLQAAKRRWKVLKRCDQNDPQIKSEIDQIETDFPEILGLPAPVLSKATRATLEGGAVVTAIENESSTAAEGGDVSDETQKKEMEAKQKLAELQTMVKNLEQKTSSSSSTNNNHNNTEEDSKKATAASTQQQQQQKDSASSQQKQQQKYLQGAMFAFQAYNSFVVSTLPSQIQPDVAEAAAAVFFAGLVAVGQFVTSSGSTMTGNNINENSGGGPQRGLCDNLIIYFLNPLLWCVPVVLLRTFKIELARCQKGNFIDISAVLVASVIRLMLVFVCAFSVYSMIFLLLQGVGGAQVPARFCVE